MTMQILTADEKRTAEERVVKLDNGVFMVKPVKRGKYNPVGPFVWKDEDGDEVAYFSYNTRTKDGVFEPLKLKTHPLQFRQYLIWKEKQAQQQAVMASEFPEVLAEALK